MQNKDETQQAAQQDVREEVQQLLLNFFVQVLGGDKDVREMIFLLEGDMFYDEQGDMLVFKLTDLHKLLCDELEIKYNEFRSLLYQSNINEELLKRGAMIEIHHSTGKVDDNVYRLIKV